MQVRRATAADAAVLAALLDAFNREFDEPTPGPAVLEERLRLLLAEQGPDARTLAYLVGETDQPELPGLPGLPGQVAGFALLTARPNVWYPGPVLLLDELYVVPEQRGGGLGGALLTRFVADAIAAGVSALEIAVDEPDTDARRFYERHGFRATDPDTGDRALFYSREL